MKHNYQVIIIGSGFGGILAAINLNRQGMDDYLIIERRSYMGGTWSQNTYPGAAVDVQSPLYSISTEPYDWSQMFVEQAELEGYTRHVIEKHKLAEKAVLQKNVSMIVWQDEACHWDIYIDDELAYQAKIVINASGPLSTPVIPDFEGRESFAGRSFHTNAWDQDYDYQDKRVAIIGSGASAAQVIPAIADKVHNLEIFQRTPHWVLPRPDYTFKAWQRKLLKQKWAYKCLRILIYWALESRVLGLKYSRLMLNLLAKRQALKLIRQQIESPILQQKVTPDFTIGCKRVILSNTLYPAYCRDNVTLHDRADGIARITPRGIMTTRGQEIELDLIVYSTGFDATDGVISYPVIGREGKELASYWHDYPRAYQGTTVPGFPNLFIVTGPNTGIGHTSALFIIESQMYYIMASITRLQQSSLRAIEVRSEAEQRYTSKLHHEMERTVWQAGGCDSWYKSRSGKVVAMFPGFSFTFRRWARRFKKRDHVMY